MKNKVFLFAVATILYGCVNYLPDTQYNDEFIKVNLSLSGEVSLSETPLTKSMESGDLLGIQVFQNDIPYAYGLFDNASNLTVYLHSGRSYYFQVQLIKGGKSLLPVLDMSSGSPCYSPSGTMHSGSSSSTEGDYWTQYTIRPGIRHIGSNNYRFSPNSSGYGLPFCLNKRGYDGGLPHENRWNSYTNFITLYFSSGRVKGYQFSGIVYDSFYPVLNVTNSFIYDSELSMAVTNSDIQNCDLALVDRYYGENVCQVDKGQTSISIDMKHLVYGIQCNVTGVSDGTASIMIKNGDKTLLYKGDISGEYHSDTKLFAFSDMHGAWEYADNYTENVTISMTWLRGVGVLQDLGSQVVQVKRNCVNVITVALGTTIASVPQNAQYDSVAPNALSLDASPFFELNNSTIQYTTK